MGSKRRNLIEKAINSDGVNVWPDNGGAFLASEEGDPISLTPQTTPTPVAVTQSANPVTGNGAVTVADGASPSNDEIYELAIELAESLEALIGLLEDAGVFVAA